MRLSIRNLSIRIKFGLVILLVVTVTTVISSILALQILTMPMEREAENELKSGGILITWNLRLLQQQVFIEASTMALREDIVQAIVTKDRESLINITRRYMQTHGIDHITVTDNKGIVLARAHDPGLYGDNISALGKFNQLTYGVSFQSILKTTTASAPIIAGGVPVFELKSPYRMIGTIQTGNAIDSAMLADLKKATGEEYSIIIDGEYLLSTLSPMETRVPTTPTTGFPFIQQIGNQRFNVLNIPLKGEGDDSPVGILEIAKSRAGLEDAILQIILSIIIASILILVFGLILAYSLATQIAKPLNRLTATAQAIGRGDYHQRTDIHSGDELETVGNAFNQMVDAISQRQKALQETNRRLEEAQALGKMGNWEFDLATQKIEWSQQVYKIYERDRALGPPSPEEEASYYSPEDVTRLREFARIATEKGEISTYDVIARLPNGKTALLNITMHPVKDEQGHVIKLFGTVQDITERKQAKEKLRESEEQYRAIFENAVEGIFQSTTDGKFLKVNPALAAMYGFNSPQEMITAITDIGQQLYANPKDRVKFKTLLEKYGFVKGFESEQKHNNGHKIWISVNAKAIKDEGGNILYYDGILQDVTERKQAEEALRESEEKYKLLTESSLTGIFIMQDKKYVYVNNRFAEMHGYKVKEMLGMEYQKLLHPDEVALISNRLDRRFKEEPYNILDVTRRINKDGHTFWVEVRVATIEYGGKPASLGNIVDVTERIRLETEREKMELKNRMTSRLAAVGEMAAGIAHEINNPLTGVIGYAELLRAQEDVPAHIKKDLETIHKGAQRVADIVKRLLAFARQTKPVRDYVNINELIQNTLELRAYQLRTSNIEVTTKLAPDLPVTVADGGQLQQVFLNIIVNAEIEMKLAHGKGKLLIKTDKVDSNIRISFKDDGSGISQENMERIFDPFFTTREVGQGTGLGLSMCHGIITEHGGRIWAESKLGKGATFLVELPIVTEKEKTEESKPVIEETRKAAKAKVLVVDDENVIRDFLSRVLTEEGHQVDTADNAEDALEKIKNERYHLILLDMKMPGTSGMELYKRIQKVARSIADRVVFITGDIMGADTEKFLSETKALYITKPFDAIKLKEEIGRIISPG